MGNVPLRNIYGCNQDRNKLSDQEAIVFIRRENLDALWSREVTTVSSNLREAKRGQRSADRFGFDSVAPPMGPFLLADDFGMKVAMIVLDRSLDPGKYAEYV
jgi:hypothetical protein